MKLLFVYLFIGAVHLVKNSVTILPKLPDVNMQVSVNGSDSTEVIALNIGDTLVNIEVCSADGTKSQVRDQSAECYGRNNQLKMIMTELILHSS